MLIIKNLVPFSLVVLMAAAPPQKDKPVLEKRLVRKKHEYYIKTAEDGTTKRNLEYTTIFDKRGNEVELTVWIPDSTYFSYGRCRQYSKEFNRPRMAFSDRLRYRYSSDTVMQIKTFFCDTLPSKKQFFSYKRNSTGQAIEKKELWFRYKANKENVLLMDSILIHSSTCFYKYNKQGLKAEEVIRYQEPHASSFAETMLYSYDNELKLRRFEKIQHDGTEVSIYKYDDNGLLSTVTWAKPVIRELNYHYNKYGQLIREVANAGHGDTVFNYSYNGNGDILKIVEIDGFTIKIKEFVYEYF